MRTIVQWLRDDRGDDLVEYALLTALVAVAGAAVLSALPSVMKDVYTSWDDRTQAIAAPMDPQ